MSDLTTIERSRQRIGSLIEERHLLYPLDVLITGPTGAGKSTLVNAIFGRAATTTGEGVDPHTQQISPFKLHTYLRFHDTPGLGESERADRLHAKAIAEWLLKRCRGEYGFIDLVMVVIEGNTRDLGTTFRLLESVVLPHIDNSRVMVVLNQADVAMKGHYWNAQRNAPEQELQNFLQEQCQSIQSRIWQSTRRNLSRPTVVSARHGYGIHELLGAIANHVPDQRRYLGG